MDVVNVLLRTHKTIKRFQGSYGTCSFQEVESYDHEICL